MPARGNIGNDRARDQSAEVAVHTIPALRAYLQCKRNYSLSKALQSGDYGKDRVMMNVIGMTAIGFLVCMAVVKIADMAVSGWLSGDGRHP
jgi:hypothetical protein